MHRFSQSDRIQYNTSGASPSLLCTQVYASRLDHNCLLHKHHHRLCRVVDDVVLVVFFLPVHSALYICSDYGASLLALLLVINKAAVTPPPHPPPPQQDKQSGYHGGPVNAALVIAGVTVCAAPRWPRKRPALLDRPLSIVAAPGLTNLQAGRGGGVEVGEGAGGSMNRDSILSRNRGHFLVIIAAKWRRGGKCAEQRPLEAETVNCKQAGGY